MLNRLLLAVVGGTGSFPVNEQLVALFNGLPVSDLSGYEIGAASRSNGTWSEYASNPVLTAGTSGAWDDGHVKDPCLLWDGSQFVMYFSGYDGATYRIGRATATSHEGPWTKYVSNPVVTLGAGGAIDDAGVNFPTVLYEPTDTGKEWKMWYGANDGSVQTVAYAHSTDGLSWTKVGRVVNVGAGGTWNDEGVLPGAIYKESTTYYLFVGGRQGTTNPRWQGGLYTFTDPEGTYTAASNPVILSRFNDSGTSPSLGADVALGSSSATVADTSPFNVGEPVMLIDGANTETPEYHYILSIDSGTQVTFDRPTVAAFESSGGVFRSFAYNSTFPRSVRARGTGGYEAFVTVFQPVEDLTIPGSKLFEGSFEFRASALAGAWSYNYLAGRGLLFPLTVGASWHSRSAENPSVIAAP